MISHALLLQSLVFGHHDFGASLNEVVLREFDPSFHATVSLSRYTGRPRSSRERRGANGDAPLRTNRERHPCFRFRNYIGRRAGWAFDHGTYRRPQYPGEPDTC